MIHHSAAWASVTSQNVRRGCERSNSTMMEVWSIGGWTLDRRIIAGFVDGGARQPSAHPARSVMLWGLADIDDRHVDRGGAAAPLYGERDRAIDGDSLERTGEG